MLVFNLQLDALSQYTSYMLRKIDAKLNLEEKKKEKIRLQNNSSKRYLIKHRKKHREKIIHLSSFAMHLLYEKTQIMHIIIGHGSASSRRKYN